MQNTLKTQVVEIKTTESDQHEDNLVSKTLDERAANILKKLDLARSDPNSIDDTILVPLLVELLDVFGEKGALSDATTIKILHDQNQKPNQTPQTSEISKNQNQHGLQSVPKPPNQRKGDWTCPNQKCSNINFAKRDRCNKCGLQKPLEFRRQDEERMRNAPVFKPGDWYCPRCNNLNFAKRKNCTRCNLPVT